MADKMHEHHQGLISPVDQTINNMGEKVNRTYSVNYYFDKLSESNLPFGEMKEDMQNVRHFVKFYFLEKGEQHNRLLVSVRGGVQLQRGSTECIGKINQKRLRVPDKNNFYTIDRMK